MGSSSHLAPTIERDESDSDQLAHGKAKLPSCNEERREKSKGAASRQPLREKRARKTKKDPNAPKRFKSSYIFYSERKYKEIKDDLEKAGITKVRNT